jgi:hypothetical protein
MAHRLSTVRNPNRLTTRPRPDDRARVFERYPRLRALFGESDAGWLAYASHRMDSEFEDLFRDLMKLRPSEYWCRQ